MLWEKTCYVLCRKRVIWTSRFSILIRRACVYKIVGKRTYITQVVSKAPDFKSFRDCATILLCASAKGNFKHKPLIKYTAHTVYEHLGEKLNCLSFTGGGTKKQEILSGCLGFVLQLLYPRS